MHLMKPAVRGQRHAQSLQTLEQHPISAGAPRPGRLVVALLQRQTRRLEEAAAEHDPSATERHVPPVSNETT